MGVTPLAPEASLLTRLTKSVEFLLASGLGVALLSSDQGKTLAKGLV